MSDGARRANNGMCAEDSLSGAGLTLRALCSAAMGGEHRLAAESQGAGREGCAKSGVGEASVQGTQEAASAEILGTWLMVAA
jgi:hypothetical protein